MYVETVRDLFEAFVIYTFLALVLEYAGGEAACVAKICHMPPLRHPLGPCAHALPTMPRNHLLLRKCKQGTLQFVLVKPLMAFTGLIAALAGAYSDPTYQACVLLVYNVSYTLALYWLFVVYLATKSVIARHSPVAKFVAVKGIVFATYTTSRSGARSSSRAAARGRHALERLHPVRRDDRLRRASSCAFAYASTSRASPTSAGSRTSRALSACATSCRTSATTLCRRTRCRCRARELRRCAATEVPEDLPPSSACPGASALPRRRTTWCSASRRAARARARQDVPRRQPRPAARRRPRRRAGDATAREQARAPAAARGGADEERGDTGDDARDAGTDLTFDHGASTSCMDDDDDDDAEVTPEKVVPARPKRTLLGALGGGLRPPGSTPKRSAAPVRLTPPPELATSGEGASGGLIATDAERSDAPAPPVHVPMVDVALGDGEQQDDTARGHGDPRRRGRYKGPTVLPCGAAPVRAVGTPRRHWPGHHRSIHSKNPDPIRIGQNFEACCRCIAPVPTDWQNESACGRPQNDARASRRARFRSERPDHTLVVEMAGRRRQPGAEHDRRPCGRSAALNFTSGSAPPDATAQEIKSRFGVWRCGRTRTGRRAERFQEVPGGLRHLGRHVQAPTLSPPGLAGARVGRLGSQSADDRAARRARDGRCGDPRARCCARE